MIKPELHSIALSKPEVLSSLCNETWQVLVCVEKSFKQKAKYTENKQTTRKRKRIPNAGII